MRLTRFGTVLVVALTSVVFTELQAASTFMPKKTYWQTFCEKHLVANDPEPAYDEIQNLRERSSNENGTLNVELFVNYLDSLYRDAGGKLYWMEFRFKAGRYTKWHVSEAEFLQLKMQLAGRILRSWLRAPGNSEDKEAVKRTLEDYGRFEES